MRAFYGSKISGHMIRTPEGYLVCKEVPIARTGTQEYLGRELVEKIRRKSMLLSGLKKRYSVRRH